MLRVIAAMACLIFCGALIAAFNSDMLTDRLFLMAKQRAEQAAAELAPQLQVDLMVDQMKKMCPVEYGPNVTLVEVQGGRDCEIVARYVLHGQIDASKRNQTKLKTMAIEQFRATGISEKLVAAKISWRYLYENDQGERQFELSVSPEDFLSGATVESNVRPAKLSGTPFDAPSSQASPPRTRDSNRRTYSQYPMADNNRPIRTLPQSQVVDAFFAEGNVLNPSQSSSGASGSRGRPRRAPKMQTNPFAK